MREWWNWQTHHLEGVAPERACEFKSRLADACMELTFSVIFFTFVTMKRSTRISVVFCFLVVVFCTLASGQIIDTDQGAIWAKSNGIDVTIHWSTIDETNVDHFEVLRSSGSTENFVSVGIVQKGHSPYDFVDYSALMRTTTVYQYQVVAHSTSGNILQTSPTVSVTHTVSGVRRTWGSIKSLFR